jgi:transcription elongation factor GreB
MSKAFTKESDDSPETPVRPPPQETPLPPGAKNYLTIEGERRLRLELHGLIEQERPQLAGSDEETAEQRRHRHLLDQRIQYLQQCLQSAVVVPPPETPDDLVRFGATVKVRWPDGDEESYRIVGVDEADPSEGRVSWLSPLAKALINSRAGQTVKFLAPAGHIELAIAAVIYQDN